MDEFTDFASPDVTSMEGEEMAPPNHTDDWPRVDDQEGAQALAETVDAYGVSHPFSNGDDHLGDSVTVPEKTPRNGGESKDDLDEIVGEDVMELIDSEAAEAVLDFGEFENAEQLVTTNNQNPTQEVDNDLFGVFDAAPAVEQGQPSLLTNGNFDDLLDPTREDDKGVLGDVEASHGVQKAEEIGIDPIEPALVEDDEFGDFDGAGNDTGGETAIVHNDDFGVFGNVEEGVTSGELAETALGDNQVLDFDGHLAEVPDEKSTGRALGYEDDALGDFGSSDNGTDLFKMNQGPTLDDNDEFGDFDGATGDVPEESGDQQAGPALVKDLMKQNLTQEDDNESRDFDGVRGELAEIPGGESAIVENDSIGQNPTEGGTHVFGDFDEARGDNTKESNGCFDEIGGPSNATDLVLPGHGSKNEDDIEFSDVDNVSGIAADMSRDEPAEPVLVDDLIDQTATQESNDEFGDFEETTIDGPEESTCEQAQAALGRLENTADPSTTIQNPEQEGDDEFGDFDGVSEDKEPALVDDMIDQTPTQEDEGEFGDFDKAAATEFIPEASGEVQAEPGDFENTADLSTAIQIPTQGDDSEFGDFDGVSEDNAELSVDEPALVDDMIDQSPTQEDEGEFGDFDKAAATEDVPEESGEVQAEPGDFEYLADLSTTIQIPTQGDDSEFGDFDGAPGVTAEMSSGEQALVVDDNDDDDDFGEFGGFENATNQSPKQADDDEFGDFGDFGEANSGVESEAVDRAQVNGAGMNSQRNGELIGTSDFLERARLQFRGMFEQYSREAESPLEESEEKSLDIVPISSILKQESENRSETHTPINLLKLLRGPREAHTAQPFAYINSKSVNHTPHLRYQSWIHKFKSSSAPFSSESVFLPSDQSSKTEKNAERVVEMASKSTIPEVKPTNRSASTPAATVVQLPAVEPRETIVELPPLPTKPSTSQAEQVAEFLKQIPDLSYMLSSKLSHPTS